MPKLLRYGLAALLVLVVLTDSYAQRRGKTRVAAPPVEDTTITKMYTCGLLNSTLPHASFVTIPDTTSPLKTTTLTVVGCAEPFVHGTLVRKPDRVIRRELRTIPGEAFTKEELIASQRKVRQLNYYDTVPARSLPLAFTEEKIEPAEEELPPPPDCRETNAINMAGHAEAYPYLSADGLRLYFTSSREGGHGRFFISRRASVNDPFGKPEVLSKHLTDGYYAGTLTADELTLCMVYAGDMFISIRKSTREEFPEPVKVAGASDHYHFGPAISPDGKEIMVMKTVNGRDRISIYKRIGNYTVKADGELPVPKGEPCPGQFSKNGLAYYFSIEIGEEEHLWRYSRTSLDHRFVDLQELPVQMKGLKNNLQPSVNSDGSILVFVTSPNELWQTDDILLVNNVKGFNVADQFSNVVSNQNNTMKVMSKLAASELSIYPNPFQANITIDMNESPAPGTTLTLYDLAGRSVRKEMLTNRRTTLSLEKFTPGVYVYHVVDGNGQVISSGKLVKGQ